jgi:hypothetical protein
MIKQELETDLRKEMGRWINSNVFVDPFASNWVAIRT